MKKNIFKSVLYGFLTIVSILCFSCSRDDSSNNSITDDNNQSNFIENFGSEINRNFIGQIIDLENNPISDATVKIGSSTTTTDLNGVFAFNNVSTYEKFAHISASKVGFLRGSRSLIPTSGINNVKIMLIPAVPIASINSNELSEVVLPSGTKVLFDGFFEDENGNSYSGSVNVSMYHLLPSDPNISNIMPGMLYAEDESGEENILESFGMINVDLRGSEGQKIQPAQGHTAEISMMIDPTQLSQADETIPLWHFDETLGYWKEDGMAIKSGNKYVGEVSHFSWWNCDVPIEDLFVLKAKVIDSNGNGLPNTFLKITAETSVRTAITDSEGNVSGYVPKNKSLYLDVIDYCGFLYESFELGSFSSDTTIPDISISSGSNSVKQITGSIINCEDELVDNGYVLNNYGTSSQVYQTVEGSYNFNVLKCTSTNSFTIQGFDMDNFQTTGTIYQSFSDLTVNNIGLLKACNDITEFVTYNYNGVEYFLPRIDEEAQNGGFEFVISARAITDVPNHWLYLYSNITNTGTYPYTSNLFFLNIKPGNSNFNIPFNNQPQVDNPIQFHFNNYGEANDYVDISFEGEFRSNFDGVEALNTISGAIHVRRFW